MHHAVVSRRDPASGAGSVRSPAAGASIHTPSTYRCQRTMRLDSYCIGVHTAAMRDVSAVARRLKQVRTRAGLSIRQVAEALGMEHGSSYQHYEDRFKKPDRKSTRLNSSH